MVATFVIARKIYQFEIKDSEIQKYLLCLGNISGDCSAYSMKKKKKKKHPRIKWVCVRFFC